MTFFKGARWHLSRLLESWRLRHLGPDMDFLTFHCWRVAKIRESEMFL